MKVFEASAMAGGRIRSAREDGYLVEAGPHAAIASDPAAARLLEIAGVQLELAPTGAPRFVVHRGRIVPLPTRPPELLSTPLLGLGAKLRLLAEPFQREGPSHETLAAFARRRLGRGAMPLVDALASGVYAGDPERLVLASAFPELRRMDQNGGIVRSLRRPTRPRLPLCAPRDGMESIVRALASRLSVTYGARVESARAASDGSATISTARGDESFDRVIVAVEPGAAREILGIEAPTPALAPVHVVAFGVSSEDGPPEGYGFLAPEAEARFVLGALFESRLFPGRAPDGYALVRCLVGGRRHPERAGLPPDEIARRGWQDLLELGVVRGEPARVFHLATRGIPQPESAQPAWFEALPRGPISVLGIGHRSVGLNALAAEARAFVEERA